jgi:hypothetical protein
MRGSKGLRRAVALDPDWRQLCQCAIPVLSSVGEAYHRCERREELKRVKGGVVRKNLECSQRNLNGDDDDEGRTGRGLEYIRW